MTALCAYLKLKKIFKNGAKWRFQIFYITFFILLKASIQAVVLHTNKCNLSAHPQVVAQVVAQVVDSNQLLGHQYQSCLVG